MKQCVLSSGGMDSFLLHRVFVPDAEQLFVDIGQPYLAKEMDAMFACNRDATGPCFKYVIATQVARGPLPAHGIILHRNALLILTAATDYQDIMLGVLAHEINSDKSQEFFTAMEQVLNIGHRGQYWNDGVGAVYQVHSPIRGYTKTRLVKEYLDKGFDPALLLATVSCYSPQPGHCGQCPSCFKRWVALTNNGLKQRFYSDPLQWAEGQGVIKKARDGTYALERAQEVLMAVGG